MKLHLLLSAILFIVIAILITLGYYVYPLHKKIAYVDNQKLFKEFKATKELEASLAVLKATHKYVIDSLTLGLNKLEQTNNRELWAKQYRYVMELSTNYTQEEEEKSSEYTQQVWLQINQYVSDYGKTNDYMYIWGANGNGSLMYADDAEAITDVVIGYINARYNGK